MDVEIFKRKPPEKVASSFSKTFKITIIESGLCISET